VNRLRRVLRRDREAGVSITEMIVTMALLSVATTLMLVLVVTVSRAFTHERTATDNAMVASNGMNELTRVIRSGTSLQLTGVDPLQPPFVVAGKNSIELYAYIDTGATNPRPIKVRFDVDGQGRVRETRWQAANTKSPWTFSTTPSSRTIARSVPAGSPQLFQYFNTAGDELAVPSTGTLTAANRELVAAVKINLTVQSDTTSRVDPVELQNTVGIPNLGVSRVIRP
jgi:hypothetical protein